MERSVGGTERKGNPLARRIHLVMTAVFLVSVAIQVFLAGLGIFAGVSLDLHRTFGYFLAVIPLVALIAAIVGRMTRRQVMLSIALNVLVHVQGILIVMRAIDPVFAALHPVNALLLFGLAAVATQEALDYASVRLPSLLGGRGGSGRDAAAAGSAAPSGRDGAL